MEIYKVNTKNYKKSLFTRFLRKYQNDRKKEVFFNLLDSIGYFNYKIDTITSDTIVINIGKRSMVDSIIIDCTYPLVYDSVQPVHFPILYDAGIVQKYAQKLLYFLAIRGYPFANISIEIKNTLSEKKSSSPDKLFKKHFTIYFNVETQKFCKFGNPLFFGEFKTKKKILFKDILFRKNQVFDIKKIELSTKRLLSRPYIADVTTESPRVITDSILLNSTRSNHTEGQNQRADSIDMIGIPFIIKDNFGMGVDGIIAYQNSADSRLSGLLNITMMNIFHRGEALSLFYRGEESIQQFNFEISIPYPINLPIFTFASFGLEIEEASYGYFEGEFKILTQLKGLWQIGGAIKGHETTVYDSTIRDIKSTDYFYGFDFILQKKGVRNERGRLSKEIKIKTGSGIANRSKEKFSRWNFNFSAGIHIPLFKKQAFVGKFVTDAITLNKKDTLHKVEQNRVGGNSSIRGYSQNQFAFNNVAYLQTEYLFYFNQLGSLYILMDGGVGFPGQIRLNSDNRFEMFGYGVGIKIPVKLGILSMEWARNYKEKRGPGRIHFRISNSVSSWM